MALEITEHLKAKLEELQSCKDITIPRSRAFVSACIKDLITFQKVLKGAEAHDPAIEKWAALLGNIYSLEDTVESLLSETAPQGQKLLIGQLKLFYQIRKLRGKVERLQVPTKESSIKCDNRVPTSPEAAGLPGKPEDLPRQPPRKTLSRRLSRRGSNLEDGDDEAPNAPGEATYSSEEKAAMSVLENLMNQLVNPLIGLRSSHFLVLRAYVSCPGKAILLWAVYNSETVKQHFHVRACINVAEVSEEIDILKDIIKQIANDDEQGKEETLHSLQQKLRNLLVWRRYLIVLYGDRVNFLWGNLKPAFPNSLSGSRVILAAPHTDNAINGRALMDSSVYLEDSGITAAESIIDELSESVLNHHRLLFLISVVGVIGSGRTTLLWPMYLAEDVKLHFDCRAWIHVPKDYEVKEVLYDILEQVTGSKSEDLSIELLQKKLRNFLAYRRYLVVLYDVWKAGIWEDVKDALPNTVNGSRVILAVHEVDVARKTNSWIFKALSGKGLLHDFEGMKGITPAARRWFDKPLDCSEIMEEESGIVGLRDKMQEQAQLVFSNYKLHQLISVLGVAGSGKTALVRAFYNSIASKQHFDCRAWISVPQDFDERDILLDLYRQLRKAKEKQSLSLEQLQKEIRLFLAWKRYLIVLDDVRSAGIWNKLEFTLPNSLNGSRVICTTRDTYLAYHMNPSSVVLALRPLDDKESWDLLSKRVTEISKESLESFQKRVTELNESRELIRKIIRRCRGLPLTILMLGGLLAEKPLEKWHGVIEETGKRGEKKEITGKDKLNSGQSSSQKYGNANRATGTQQASSSGKDSSIEETPTPLVSMASSKIKQEEQEENESEVDTETSTSGEDELSNTVAISYRDLPRRTKCCLLYLGLFPKEYHIPIRRLFQLWLADGLVASSGKGSAEHCFEQLLDRSLIEIADRKVDGRHKTCRVTNSLYDNLFLNAKNVGFFHIHDNPNTLESTVRRLAGHLEIIPKVKHFRHLRSYISFCKKRGDAPTAGVNELLNNVMKVGFPMLAVLDLEGVYKPLLPEALGKLLMLKYLGLRRTLLDSIPESVGDLPHLETLDVKHTYITSLPGTLWQARKLQHLYMSEITVDVPIRKKSSHGSVSNLQTLWGLIIRQKIPEKNWLERLVELRKLKLTCHEASIQIVASLKKLESLKLRSINESNEPAELKLDQIGQLENLSRLYLLGMIPQPNLDDLPRNLESLTLSMSKLSDDPMPKLGKLEKLKVLKLYARSYMGKEMTCESDGFPQLQVLKLWMLKHLEKWTVKKDAMRGLKQVEIRCCKRLEVVEGLEKLNLNQLLLTNMNPSFIRKIEQKIGSKKVDTQSLTFAAEWHVEDNPVYQRGKSVITTSI